MVGFINEPGTEPKMSADILQDAGKVASVAFIRTESPQQAKIQFIG
jgi:hypothetical protein